MNYNFLSNVGNRQTNKQTNAILLDAIHSQKYLNQMKNMILQYYKLYESNKSGKYFCHILCCAKPFSWLNKISLSQWNKKSKSQMIKMVA